MLDWASKTNQYNLRVRPAIGGPVTTKVVLGRPRCGPEADIEFFAHWVDENQGDPVSSWHVLSVTDVALQVTYLPNRGLSTPMYYWGDYVVPDRGDNPRFYDCQLQLRTAPQQLRGYSLLVEPTESVRDIPKVLRTHSHLKGAWQLVPGSIREIGLEQHHYLTWQRRQQPNYYLWEERQEQLKQAETLALTKKQQEKLMHLILRGYVLHHTGQAWEVGQIKLQGRKLTPVYLPLITQCHRAADAIEQAVRRFIA